MDKAAQQGILLHEVFAATARKHPGQIAIDVPPGAARPERVRFSYAEVDAASDDLAARLRPLISDECIVAIHLPRTSPDLYIAQLAVLKAGAAFTCIDPAFPPERVAEILDDSGAVALLLRLARLPWRRWAVRARRQAMAV